ncbi:FRAS1-related extracellular matrix protein 1-like [Tubulanus polymorphus]|uniref:FRAS1-related extracellular matrix protein 1-like n=1 Tax=Tubulanus polymorphus TaxID=672921 RepID=UPI003DA44EF0
MLERLGIIVCLLFVAVHCRIVSTKRDVRVKIGRAVYIDPYDLIINGTDNDHHLLCKIEVDSADPMSQRVGEVSPKAFDCKYKPKFVKYTHNGSPLLREDQVKLRVYRFSVDDVESDTIYLNIVIVKEPYDIFVVNDLTHPVVEEFNGVSNFIDASALRFRFDMRNNASCMVGFNSIGSAWPIAGQVVHGPDKTPVHSIWRECHEFLFMQLQYEHLVPSTPEVDYIPLTVEVNDPNVGIITEQMYLAIDINGAFPNMPPKASFMSEYLLDVGEFVLTVISPNIMTATDNETPRASLVYNVSRPLLPGQGHLVNLADQTQEISSFVQADLANRNIAYQPPNISYTDRTDFSIEFTIFDSHFAHSLPLVLHISVRPSETIKPRVTLNTGLVLVEGQSAKVTNDNLQIVDRDNIDNVEILVKPGGLNYGNLFVSGQKAFVFNPQDIALGRVYYRHDGGNSVQDYMLLRISDGSRSIQIRFYFHIIPIDDTPPMLISERGFEVKQGDTLQIESDMLQAKDEDSPSSDIMYAVTQAPAHGNIVRKYRTGSVGQNVGHFLQEEINRGYIFYQHNGDSEIYDTFHFTLSDQNVPPNVSPKQMLQIDIKPVLAKPPVKVANTVNVLEVLETEVAVFTRDNLAYDDPDTDDGHVIYTVTVQPFFPPAKVTVDSGRLINTRNMSMLVKDPSLPAITEFTQAEVNHLLIAFMPPDADIGTEPAEIVFYYSLSDNTGNTIAPQPFVVRVLPVNNQPPELNTNTVKLKEGAQVTITQAEISATDIDTKSEELEFAVDVLPRHGMLKKYGQNMIRGDKFNLTDLDKGAMVYFHDGSDTEEDQFMVKVNDGVHFISKIVPVDVTLVDDQKPVMRSSTSGPIIVSEGGEMVISPATISAADPDTPDEKITFIVVRPPTKGSIYNYRSEVNRFTQRDVKDGRIKYMHRNGDVGYNPEFDGFSFVVTDKPGAATTFDEDFPSNFINITILPVNDKAPEVVVENRLVVKEGGKVTIAPNILTANDQDSEPIRLRFEVTKKPEWGFIENTKPDKGSEISNTGKPITEFSLQDIDDGAIRYVQANHQGVEPLHDMIVLKVNDGDLYSPETLLPVSIIPQNDEKPTINLSDFEVGEGKEKIIDIAMLNATDADLPGDRLMFSVARKPRHGDIKMMMQVEGRSEGMIQVPMHDFTLRDLQNHMVLMYQHDGSENFDDRFTIRVDDGQHVTRRICKVKVHSTNDERPNIVKNAGLNLEYRETAFITSSALWTMDVDNLDSELWYVVIRKPKKGILQKRVPIGEVIALRPGSELSKTDKIWIEIDPGVNFTQSDLLNNRIRYNHLGGLDKMSGDSFVFKVTDGTYSTPYETFEIKIENSKISEIDLQVKNAKVKENGRTIIGTDSLSASDGSGMASRLRFFVWRTPLYGQIELANRRGFAIRNFTQLDLASARLLYSHTAGSSENVEDFMKFTITNGFQTKNGTLYFHIIPNDRITPTLDVNRPLPVKRGEEKVITPAYLSVYDPDTDAGNVSYFIMKHPDHGEILNRGLLVINKFNQSDIKLGNILYKSFSSDAMIDQFWFIVSDNKHIGFLINNSLQLDPVPFKILLSSKDILPPKLIRNKMPTMLETFDRGRVGYLINNRFLKTMTFDGSGPGDIVYTLLERPIYGYLEDTVTKRRLRNKFTQKDLDAGRILYVINADHQVSRDNFLFEVHDAKGNTIPAARFEMRWPVIEFSLSEYTVCEDVGTLSVGIKRTGAVHQSAYINVRVKEMSAKIGVDIGNQDYAQIQFDPGVTMVTWNIRITEDFLDESDERFKLLLKSPVNALIGQEDKCVIIIINKDKDAGKCPPVPGMVNKYGVVPIRKDVSNTIDTPERIHRYHSVSGSYSNNKLPISPLHQNDAGTNGDRRMKSKTTALAKWKKEKRRQKRLRKRKQRLQVQRKRLAKKNKQKNKKTKKNGKKGKSNKRKKDHSLSQSHKDGLDVGTNSEASETNAGNVPRKTKKKKMKKKFSNNDDADDVENNDDNARGSSPGARRKKGPKRGKRPGRKAYGGRGGGKWKKKNKAKKNNKNGDNDRGAGDDSRQTEQVNSEPIQNIKRYRKPIDEGMQIDHTGMQVDQWSSSSSESFQNSDTTDLAADDSSIETKKKPVNSDENAGAWSQLPDDIKESLKESHQTIGEMLEKKAAGQDQGDIRYVDTCNSNTKGMLHLDPATDRVYKCDGTDWLSLEEYLARVNAATTKAPNTSVSDIDKERKSGIDCGEGWREFSGICYKVIELMSSWDEAENYCLETYNAHLPSIWLAENLEWLHDLAGREAFWLGLNQKSGYRRWEYCNGDPVTYTNWKPGFPRGGRDSYKNCALVRKEDKLWTNRECNLQLGKVICTRYSNQKV